MKKFSGEVGTKFHQSCLVALVFCTKLYTCIKLAVSLCSFSQFSFPFNFRTANALVLKFCTLLLSCLFSNTLLAIFDIFFSFKNYSPFCTEKWAKIDMRERFQHNFISKSRARFLVHRFYLLRKKNVSGKPGFNLKAIEFGAFFTYCNPGNFCKLITKLTILAFHKLLIFITGRVSQYTLILEN